MLEFELAQCLMNGKDHTEENMQCILRQAEQDRSVLAKPLSDKELEVYPVRIAVRRAATELLPAERDDYGDYAAFFMQELQAKANTIGVICGAERAENLRTDIYAVSQGFFGDVQLIGGIAASEGVFLELARRCSGETFSSVDALAFDSVQELLNVIHGMYAIALAQKGVLVDLGLPRSGRRILATASRQLYLKVLTSYGSFSLVLAADEFVE